MVAHTPSLPSFETRLVTLRLDGIARRRSAELTIRLNH